MSDITIIEPTTKRRTGTLLTDRLCETRVAKRVKYYDRKCRGLYVSITPAGIATFSCNFTNAAGRPTSSKIGIHHPELFKVADARAKVSALKAKGGAAIGEILAEQKSEANKRGVTVDQVIAARVEWMKTLVKKADHELRPRVESWRGVRSHLLRFISPRLGRKIASEVTNSDIATLSNDIVAGQYIVDGKVAKKSTANARHMRRAASAMFKWAALAGNDYIKVSPCVNLPPLEKEPPRSRTLTTDEIRILWHGLDRNLALEILTESMGNHDFAFVGRFGDAPLARQAMSGALKGTKRRNGNVKTPGICALLSLAPFTPHDLRRTAATMCGRLRLPESNISLCLDHQATKDENGKALPAITGKVYNHDVEARVVRKREVLDAWAVELRRIIGDVPVESMVGLLAA